MSVYSLGFETKEGLEIGRYSEDGTMEQVIAIDPEKFFEITQANRVDLKRKFLDQIEEQDTVISPAGNFLILEAIVQRTENVYWVPTQYLEEYEKTVEVGVEALYLLWQDHPQWFYRFQATDSAVRRIRQYFGIWMQREKERVAVSNAYFQLLRRLRDDLLLLEVPEEDFVADYVATHKDTTQRILRAGGQRPTKKKTRKFLKKRGWKEEEIEDTIKNWNRFRKVLDEELIVILEKEAKRLYKVYTGAEVKPKEIRKAEQDAIERRLQPLLGAEEEMEEAIRKELKKDPFPEINQALQGVGTRMFGGVVAMIRSPLLYSSVQSLLAYFNLLPYKGRRRLRHEAAKMGGARFEAERLIRFEWTDQPAFFQNEALVKIYRAYKLWRWLVYYPLYKLSQEIFQYQDQEPKLEEKVKDFARRLFCLKDRIPIIRANDEVKKTLRGIWGSGSARELRRVLDRFPTPPELEEISEKVDFDLEQLRDNPGFQKVKELASQIEAVTDNDHLLKILPYIRGTGNWDELWEVVSRGKGGHNIQVRPIRLERAARGEVGKQVVKFIYYKWLEFELKQREGKTAGQNKLQQYLDKDGEYVKQRRRVLGPESKSLFQLEVVGAYYAQQATNQAQQDGYHQLEDIPEPIREACGDEHIEAILEL